MKNSFAFRIVLFLIFIISFVAGCGGGNNTNLPPSSNDPTSPPSTGTSQNVIYTGGEYTAPGTAWIPCYWDNNGEKHNFPFKTNLSYMVKSIFVSNNIVYAGGYIDTNSGNACYWDNNREYDLPIPSGATRGYVNSIFIKDNIVYTCGYYVKETAHFACYWIGSTIHELSSNELGSNSNLYAHANSIFVDNTKVYVGGDIGGTISTPNPCYWTDSKIEPAVVVAPTLLSNSTIATVKSIFAYNNDIYSCYENHSISPYLYFSSYWVNTTLKILAVPAGYTGHVTTIFVNNNSFYAGGYYSNGSNNVVCYWDNSGRHDLENTNDSVDYFSIIVKNSSVYVGGIKRDSSGDNAYYWDSTGGHPVYHFPQYNGWGFCPVFMQ